MSYEDTNCPCGGTKERETMLCKECMEALKDHPCMRGFLDARQSTQSRRHDAVVLVTLAARRKHQRKPAQVSGYSVK